ncbi:MAG: hypothetical protein UY07_C0006G0013 [Parcubacteria group bacterium GW2011_GWA1_47_8]|nr:MAG: hypothetical protein UY07_C0006G0013 [Parcubacteria group bacterium GW2011_GWA1_47_8]
MRKIFISLITLYQKLFSPDIGILTLRRGTTCVFYPTCSAYTKEAIIKYGVIKGIWLGLKRVGRCHPWQKNHIDPLL